MRISSEIRMWECGPACPIKQCLAAREDQICDGNVKSFKLWIEIKPKCCVLQNVVGCAKFLPSFNDSFPMGVANI
ncbi:hypothetical protein GLYMA_01G093150v4 [Glycine max]|nr:hypothetical protein GLYMA_01G093150v4 [Glycine max]